MIAKGRTSIRAGIDFEHAAYKQIIEEQSSLICAAIKNLEDEIGSINNDASIDVEEISSLCNPLYNAQLDITSQYALFNQSIFCAIYCFWETGLCRIIRFYERTISVSGQKPLKTILALGFPCNPDIELINESIRELRNYFVHGSLSKERKERIQACLEKYGESGLDEVYDGYSISSANFLHAILELVYKTLCEIEAFCDENSKNKIQ
ncbi:MAG: hypothetical protein NC396_04630 [Bacteroides sp.]|nr:hypothetical protein [Bacteroides sp.]MCM1085645.1 hypothetical protein [Bacteroides sp.]